ncbi:hypothetical protein LCGC14_2692770 [marine sediment metagenome]|uniref:RNA polymerase sigma factor n=1 Tax=marine sediment metagenome TaxID=412755 RepID=A0A0F9BSP5_9ZZZZ
MGDGPAKDLSRCLPRMYRVALRFTGDADSAQDVVQEACVKALRNMTRFDGRSSLATWLHRITVNCAVDHLRARGRFDDAEIRAPQELADLQPCLEVNPAVAMERQEIYRLAIDLVGQLPEDCRTAFILTQLDGYSYDQAAEIENQPRGTIASRVFRAKKILLDQLRSKVEGRAKT